MQALSHYDMSDDRGFLCRFNAEDVNLPSGWDAARTVALRLPQILPTKRVRDVLSSGLPDFADLAPLSDLSDAQAKLAMVHYSFMVQAYVWGEDDAPVSLPARLARPISALSERIGQPPLLPYSSYVLDNWGRLNSGGPIDLDNIYMIQNFLSGQDEAWFVLVHVAIEAKAGKILAAMKPVIEAVNADDAQAAQNHLERMATVWSDIQGIFNRMPDQCDPYVYFERVRPYIHGWKDNPALPNGLIYEGVEKYGGKPQAFRGQTGSQSSIVPSMDALLCVGHASDPLRTFLDELHIYRPPGHRQFIDDVRAGSDLRNFVTTVANKGLTESYNANIQAVADFRSRHLEYAATYINKQSGRSKGNDTDVGTGGTPFMRYLKKHRDETEARLIRA